MSKEILDIVDENGNVTGSALRVEAYEKGLLHPAVNVIIFNTKNQVFIQRRAANKDAFPLFWDISVAEHLKQGETFEAGAIRGLSEELSVDFTEVSLLRSMHLQMSEYSSGDKIVKEFELVELYGVVYDGEVVVNNEEVAEGKFVDISSLERFSEKDFTPWGLDEIRFLLQQDLNSV